MSLETGRFKDFVAEVSADYLSNEPVIVTLECLSVEADIIGTIIRNYISDIQLPNLDLDLSIQSMELVASSEETIDIQLNITMENPVDLTLTLNNVTFDLLYSDIFIGNITTDTITLTPGSNIITLNGVLTSEVNRTNLEAFLSEYIGGKDVLVDITGAFSSNFSGLISSVEIPVNTSIILVGLEDFVKSVIVEDIDISISAGFGGVTVTYTVTLRLTVENPLSFEIDLIAWGGDIYFDDTDASSFGLLSYGAQYGIYLTTISNTGLSDVLPAQTTYNLSHIYSDNDIENGIRLNDELNKNKLFIDFLNGWLVIKIGNFEITLSFELFDIPVEQQ